MKRLDVLEPVIQSTALLIDVKSPPFLATVITLGSWLTSYNGASIGIVVFKKVSVPSILPVAVGCSIKTSCVSFSKLRAEPYILGAEPVFGAYIAVVHLWKLTAVNLNEPPFSTQNPVPAAAPTAFVNKHPLTMNAHPGWSALAKIKPVVVVIPPFVDVTFLSCILPIPLPSFVT